MQDLKEPLEKLLPSDLRYHHDDRWGDDNFFSHRRASLFGPSLQIPIHNRRLLLGAWHRTFFSISTIARAPARSSSKS